MPPRSPHVSYSSSDPNRVPDQLTPGAWLLADLQRRGKVEQLMERLRVRRQGGYCGVDAFLMLLVYFSSGLCQGIRTFWARMGRYGSRLAALAGRVSLPSPAALSRLLARVEDELLRPVAPLLLAEIAEIDAVMRHPAMQTYDAQGQAWQVFDIDPTVTTLRQRALPGSTGEDDLPEPVRRADETGSPGYSGRKRGDIQFRRIAVQHAGSGAWVHGHLSRGNGQGVADFGPALDTIVATSQRLEHPLSHVLCRADGEYGNVPHITLFRQRGLPFVTRLNRAGLYDDPEILTALRNATWCRVSDSGCEPHRAAADLGRVTLTPDRNTKRPDGSGYEQVTVRVVASIFPKTGSATHGRIIDGWQVELFAADLPVEAWPAAEVIAAYFAHAAQENRFAQEDRELGLDRIFSYDLSGQEFATLVGLAVWNLRLAHGFALDPPPVNRPAQPFRHPQAEDRLPAHWPRDPKILKLLDELEWANLLARRPGWTWDADLHQLRCPDGRILDLTTVRPKEHAPGRTGIIFCRPTGGCEDCLPRAACLRTSVRRPTSRHAEFSIPTPIADKLRQRLALLRAEITEPAVVPCTGAPGFLAVRDSLFLPAAARGSFRNCFVHVAVRIGLQLPPPPPPRSRLLAVDTAHRQRRRQPGPRSSSATPCRTVLTSSCSSKERSPSSGCWSPQASSGSRRDGGRLNVDEIMEPDRVGLGRLDSP